MKLEWRKLEKSIYLPKHEPMLIHIPKMNFITLSGAGNPNEEAFSKYIEALYAAAYGIRMTYKNGLMPRGFEAYTVYPLEGVWDISTAAKERNDGMFTKDEFVYDLMIRQPDFVSEEMAFNIIEQVMMKKNLPLLKEIKWLSDEEGMCVQMLHIGSYDQEPVSFEQMESFCVENGLKRITKKHREIYLSDARKVPEEKLNTILRIKVEIYEV